MATFQVTGLDNLINAFERLAELPDGTIEAMLLAEANIVAEAQKRTAASMLQGPYYAGGVAESVTVGKMKKAGGARTLSITFDGTQHGEPLARIAMINEYGKTNQPARPFARTAIEECAPAAEKAAQTIYETYLNGVAGRG
jgi:HK97 gp10 family phage protein